MKVFSFADSLPALKDPVVTLGSFDGVHMGHRKLLGRVVERAAAAGGESVALTFSQHPRQVLDGAGMGLLNTLREKLYLLEETGVGSVVLLPFDERIAAMTPGDFVRDIIIGRIGTKELVVGYDHRFGRGQEGDHSLLEEMAARMGFSVERVDEFLLDGSPVSSSEVRRTISRGDMERAAELLGRGYVMIAHIRDGIVVPGGDTKLLPPAGTYRVLVGEENPRPDTLQIDHEGILRLTGEYGNRKELFITFGR